MNAKAEAVIQDMRGLNEDWVKMTPDERDGSIEAITRLGRLTEDQVEQCIERWRAIEGENLAGPSARTNGA
jgi:hypothetical protein